MLKQVQTTHVSLSSRHHISWGRQKLGIGSFGHLSIFLWALGMVWLVPLERGIIPALCALAGLVVVYPYALRRLAKPRWLIILSSLFLVNILFGFFQNDADRIVLGFPFSSIALVNGAQMTLRAIIILLAADGLSSSVNIIEIAGLLERSGMHGLGFSIGVATNLLPDLRQSGTVAWHSLRMRGGLRANWWRGIQLLLLTVLSNALRHVDEIVLAAEVRAFRPEHIRKSTLRIGALDWWILSAGLSLLVISMVIK